MATNKERIKNLELGLEGLQTSVNRMEKGVADKLHQLEVVINKMFEVVLSSKISPANANPKATTLAPAHPSHS